MKGFAAIACPREKLKIAHSYAVFGLVWGTIPFLGAYFTQAGTISLFAAGLSVFVGASVVMMHHLAIMSRECPAWKGALCLLTLYRFEVYVMAILALVGMGAGIWPRCYRPDSIGIEQEKWSWVYGEGQRGILRHKVRRK